MNRFIGLLWLDIGQEKLVLTMHSKSMKRFIGILWLDIFIDNLFTCFCVQVLLVNRSGVVIDTIDYCNFCVQPIAVIVQQQF